MNYECHVTVERPEDANMYEDLAHKMAWKTSYIVGDPLLGKRGFFYFTTHHGDYEKLFHKMKSLCGILGDKVIREKIELIVYDTKNSVAHAG